MKGEKLTLIKNIALVTTRDPSPLSVYRNEERVFLRHTQEKSDCDLRSARGIDGTTRCAQHHHLRRGRSKPQLTNSNMILQRLFSRNYIHKSNLIFNYFINEFLYLYRKYLTLLVKKKQFKCKMLKILKTRPLESSMLSF